MRFAHRLQAVSEARRWLGESLHRSAPDLGSTRIEEALLMASELVTNVVEHTSSEPEVTVTQTADSVRVEVSDEDPGTPVVQPANPTRVGGNGLRIVDRWSDTWGVTSRPGDGKVVWFSVARGDATDATPMSRSTTPS
ncbi:MAG: putative regulatory protein [Acidimicrobiales bacterium]|nr:putative regulatory protein [Acidimicrobiales bacterium]